MEQKLSNEEVVLVKKGFEYTIYDWNDVLNPNNNCWSDTVYADTAGKARYMAFMSLLDAYDVRGTEERKECFTSIKVRRAKYMDRYIGKPHEKLSELSHTQLALMKHCWGFDSMQPGYRNHYNSQHDEDWESLVEQGIAFREDAPSTTVSYMYCLTPLGIEILQTLVPKRLEYFIQSLNSHK